MAGKRALIVDDSKSARAFLAKILERHELRVDSAESAEQAIDYLADHRPDVIFMDHLMPGMDGFQAVQAIKNNPRTAMIPIMMYTSQEGELYLGQARALGAVGVLPKQIKPADVSKVLYQLHLAADRRSTEQTSFKPYIGDADATIEEIALPAPVAHPLTDVALREQLAELRRALMSGLDSQSERVAADVRSMFLEGLPARRPHGAVPWLATLLSLIVAISAAVLWRQEAQRTRLLSTELAELRDMQRRENAAPGARSMTAPAAAASKPATAAASAPSEPIVGPVPYGEDVFAGARLDLIRTLLRRLEAQNFRGVVDIASYPGRFCLVGNPAEGYSVAPDETPVSRCDLIGNPYDESQTGTRQPLALANLIGDFRHATHNAADVRLSTGDSAAVVNTYPAATLSATAGEWNRAAAANNRIEIRVQHGRP